MSLFALDSCASRVAWVPLSEEGGWRARWKVVSPAVSTCAKATLLFVSDKMEAVVTLLTWNHAALIGVRAIDDQHGVLMDTLNEIRLVLAHGGGRDQVSEGLNRLIEFTRMHFSSEERLLEHHGYPGIAEYREAHRRLLDQIEEAAKRAHHDDELHMHSMLAFLRTWHFDHVEGADRQYGAWLNQRGIA